MFPVCVASLPLAAASYACKPAIAAAPRGPPAAAALI